MKTDVYISIAEAYFKQGKYELAADEYRKAIRSDPRSGLKAYEGLAEVYQRLNILEKGVKVWQTALRFFPENPKIYYHLGCIYQELKKDEEAIDSYQKAVSLEPSDEKAHYYLGMLYYEKGMIIDSIREFQTVLYINQADPNAYSMLGQAFIKLGEFEKGRTLIKKAIEIREGSVK